MAFPQLLTSYLRFAGDTIAVHWTWTSSAHLLGMAHVSIVDIATVGGKCSKTVAFQSPQQLLDDCGVFVPTAHAAGVVGQCEVQCELHGGQAHAT